MKDYQVSSHNLQEFMTDLQKELIDSPVMIVSTQSANTGKWKMSKLWRAWMATTADFMAEQGCTMPLMIKPDGTTYGKKPFDKDDAHDLFTYRWLGTDENGKRLSWAKKSDGDNRVATKGERYSAMLKHEVWASDKGVILLQPRDSEFEQLNKETTK